MFRTDNTLIYDRQGYIDRVLSSSYSLKEGEEGYTEYLKEINHIFTYNVGRNDNSYNFDAAGVFYPEEKES